MDIEKIGKFEAIFLIVIIMANKIILNIPKTVLKTCGSSSWLNALYISIIALLFVLLICKLFKNFMSYDILDISNYLAGKHFKTIVGFLFLLAPFVVCFAVLNNFSQNLKLIYFPDSPLVFILLIFIVGMVISNNIGFKAIMKNNLIILPVVLLSIIIILISTTRFFVPQRIFPILGNGFNETFLSGATNIFAFSGITYIYFLLPFLKKKEEFKKICVISIIISSIYLFLSVTCLLLAFSFMTITEEPFSIYLITRILEYGRFFQRTDAIFILIWILAAFSYLSISLFFISHIFKKITNISNPKCMNYSFGSLILGLSLIPENHMELSFIANTIYKYYLLILIFILAPIILILANFKKKKEERKELKT